MWMIWYVFLTIQIIRHKSDSKCKLYLIALVASIVLLAIMANCVQQDM